MDAYHSLEKKQKNSSYTFDRTFSPVEDSCDDILKALLGTKFITLPKSNSYGNPFLDIYCSYHRHNEHSTSECIELKHKIQDLIDNGIIDTSNDSCDEDTLLEKYHTNEPMSSDGFLDTSTFSNIRAPPNTSNLSNMPLPNKKPNAFHVHSAYPQGLPLKETQDNLHLSENLLHATMTKDPSTTPSTTSFTLHSPLSFEVAPC